MVITKEHLKMEIDSIQHQYIEIVYRILQAFSQTTQQPTMNGGLASSLISLEPMVFDKVGQKENSTQADDAPFLGSLVGVGTDVGDLTEPFEDEWEID
ncbi:MAG: hypothetical protein AAF639_06705 [Chloroflexota bacterium]